ncbi:MAG: Trigger factor [uncultured bacterium]|uniref:Trigger factor ribosome-binding bacterial domain-containing protein n=1 Tax=Candidatus Woesebacteria bacterium RIFCSPHIGHO2_12_FULL_41_24 TaxID=1802510 RepID=A0A1F8AR45_9BACT|nr:MAG: Trigger factor [uncultured bacterium]OGM13342.1 MAG: hypothetical protein A2W15_05565 [Candidatus Woesebacteria bacterium RBG_16_41_13]OGM30916.1 MAG: hypothetical protein A2873_03880 [Candidatus Woesebacteria bacterium RIFCSPHIGHO2_01_FULL_42_80]OGM35885.1 MAG: hypothetical protein A3D84_01350 [Candidatus Woesebacteria bacterium RIFCSPHIGHO2_02_FULL_42_20]OGM54222.1 MAG: hypothetical protein A3E44_00905 [Candidatus Woesebacteria bacterium RIFCSPHIGHO2_12_FULL_41_24]OGM66135.1 MAG: hyp
MVTNNSATIPTITSTIAREADKSVLVSLSVPIGLVEDEIEKVLEQEAKHTEVAGFRKGMAPKHLVRKNISEDKLLNMALSSILPKAFSEAVKENKLNIIMYPKFEISAKKESVIEVKAVTCEVPEIDLGDYRELIKRNKRISTDQPTREQKDGEIIRILIEKFKNTLLPKVLVSAEVDLKLANLLSRLEKLGLTLESYLQSTGKTPETLRKEYEEQVRGSLILDFVLSGISSKENIKIEDTEAVSYFKAANPNSTSDPNENQLPIVKQALKKRKALDILTSLL